MRGINLEGIWKRNITWQASSGYRTDISISILKSSALKIAEFHLPDGGIIRVSANELRRALEHAPLRKDGTIVGPYNIDPKARTIHRTTVEMSVIGPNTPPKSEFEQWLERNKDLAKKEIKKQRLSLSYAREGQSEFRALLLSAYGGSCAISGITCTAAIEAAHIIPYNGNETNVIENGILLRSDLHSMFDSGLLNIGPEYQIEISDSVTDPAYKALHGTKIRLPRDRNHHPNPIALALRTMI